jgi:glycine/D-amino acid oxidase-like deaminating enzyme
MMVDYYHATRDGRVAFGKGGSGIALGGRIGADFDRSARRARIVEADLRRTYPALADVPVTPDWNGPIARPPTSLPLLGRLGGRPPIL